MIPNSATALSRELSAAMPRPAVAPAAFESASDPDVAAALAAVDWSFQGRAAPDLLESIHPYPAKFIGSIPGSLLDRLPLPRGTAVLDPFVGSGTTLIECQKRGIVSFGIDLNPIACLISRVKTSPPPSDIEAVLAQVISRATAALPGELPAIPNLAHWFDAAVAHAISRLVSAISTTPEIAKEILRTALSSILVRVSRQESDTRYAAIEKHVSADDVFRLFNLAAQRLIRALREKPTFQTRAHVIESDVLKVDPTRITLPIGAVITSPPYPNAYEYWLYHKYRMWWLGYDPLQVKDQEIGARAHFFGPKRHSANEFADQMAGTFDLIDSVLVPNGYACFVVGRSKIHGEIIDNAATITRVAALRGYVLDYKVERPIAATRKSFNLSHANIRTETILVLRRP